MRVEFIKELDPDDDKLEIPWADPAEPRLQYVDLKDFPQKIDELEECRQRPTLAGLLRGINAPGSAYRSAKCDFWTTTHLSEDERLDFKLPVKVGSYVDLVFERPELNSQIEPYCRLGERISQELRLCHVQAQMEIALRRCLFHREERWGYYLTIFTHAYGSTVREAEDEWRRATEALGCTLAGIDQTIRQELFPSRETSPSQ